MPLRSAVVRTWRDGRELDAQVAQHPLLVQREAPDAHDGRPPGGVHGRDLAGELRECGVVDLARLTEVEDDVLGTLQEAGAQGPRGSLVEGALEDDELRRGNDVLSNAARER